MIGLCATSYICWTFLDGASHTRYIDLLQAKVSDLGPLDDTSSETHKAVDAQKQELLT